MIDARDGRRLFLAAAGGITLWLLATFLWQFSFGHGRQLTHILFLDQDFPALLIGLAGLLLMLPFLGGRPIQLPAPTARIILPIILICVLLSWIGHYWTFQDYALSRDEEVAEFAAAYMRDGMLARPIPPAWIDFRRAIMPEFFSPFGATTQWAAAYLPLNSAIRALFWRLGDPNLAGPMLLGTGLVALWRIALRLFPTRPDTVWVVMLLAVTSAQLSVTAMTPYAMTGHFALNMVWLALLLRGDMIGNIGAGVMALILGGLHQWHFPPLFLGPFLLWLLLQRRWGALAFHAFILALLVVVWAKLWPHFLLEQLGPPADVRPTAGVADKVGSLFARLDKWQPLFNLTRLLAWNNILLLPLAIIGIISMGWRKAIRGETVALPLALGAMIACALALSQGHGWGYRYGHGYIGSLALLAGFGWNSYRIGTLRPIMMATWITIVAAAFLIWHAHAYVAPYAASARVIHASGADVVLVDPRGGLFATDLVRPQHGDISPPVVMNLATVPVDHIAQLCASHDVAIFDRRDFLPLGIRPARWSTSLDDVRELMQQLGCGRRIAISGLPPAP